MELSELERVHSLALTFIKFLVHHIVSGLSFEGDLLVEDLVLTHAFFAQREFKIVVTSVLKVSCLKSGGRLVKDLGFHLLNVWLQILLVVKLSLKTFKHEVGFINLNLLFILQILTVEVRIKLSPTASLSRCRHVLSEAFIF